MLKWDIKVILKIEDQRSKIKINLKRSPLVIFLPKRSRSPVMILKIKIKDRDLCPSLFVPLVGELILSIADVPFSPPSRARGQFERFRD